jgi:hypothetical protein
MKRSTAIVLGLVIVLGGTAWAEGEKAAAKKPLGSWKRKAGDFTITFNIKEDAIRVVVVNGENAIDVQSDYGVTKDGVLFGRISKVTKKGITEGPSDGDLFSLQFKIDKDTLTLSEYKSTHDSPDVKQLLQGDYEKVKDI